MLFVPLTLIVFVVLSFALIWFARTEDLSHLAHRLFLGLIGLYAVQSLLLTLRWGYGIAGAAGPIAMIAPVLPVLAYLSYRALTGPLSGRALWPAAIIAVNWLALMVLPDLADVLIPLTYLGFGGLLILVATRGVDQVVLSPLDNAGKVVRAMALTGGALVASGLTDVYIIFDFITNAGRNVGMVSGVLPSVFVLIVGLSAALGRVSSVVEPEFTSGPDVSHAPSVEDVEIVARLEALFETEGLHRNEELSLRRLSRRLSQPDRRVSNAINRTRGQSVSQFVNEYRVREACDLLINTSDTILAVSLAAGFATKSNFNREFVRITGTSPSQWRRQNRAPSQA